MGGHVAKQGDAEAPVRTEPHPTKADSRSKS
jgi:hypothetical protein